MGLLDTLLGSGFWRAYVDSSTLEHLYGIDIDTVKGILAKNRELVERFLSRHRNPGMGLVYLIKGVLNGILFTEFLKKVVENEKKRTGKDPLIVSVGRDAIPFLIVLSEIKKHTEHKPGLSFIGISSTYKELHKLFKRMLELAKNSEEVEVPNAGELRKLKAVLRRLDNIRKKYDKGSIVLVDTGVHGTHVVPIAIIARGMGIDARTALFQAFEEYSSLVDHLGYKIPKEGFVGALLTTEDIPHITGPFTDLNRPRYFEKDVTRESVEDWKVYEIGLRLGARHALGVEG